MTFTFTDGNQTTNGTEQTLFDVSQEAHYACWIFAHNMQSGDELTIKTYVYDSDSAALRLFSTDVLNDAQGEPAWFKPFVPTPEYKVTIQRTGGTDRNYTWQRIDCY